jgi:hypothetical protein
MRSVKFAAVAILGCVTLVGCKKDQPTTPPELSPRKTPQTDTNGTSMMDKAKDATSAAGDKMGAMATDAKNTAGNATDAMTTQASTLIDQGMQYVKENKWDMADKTMTQLDAMKDKIPASLQPKYDQLKALYEKSKPAAAAPKM